jgi:response regulator RpfG family c-di-GMP phosphodiesterase
MDWISTRTATGQRVLLVENHPANVAAMRSLFQRNGCNVRTAHCAADAMIIHALEPFDFVVINTEMVQAGALSEHLTTRGKMRQQDVFAYAMKPTQGA